MIRHFIEGIEDEIAPVTFVHEGGGAHRSCPACLAVVENGRLTHAAMCGAAKAQPSHMTELTGAELDVMEHATAWRHGNRRLFRNYFTTNIAAGTPDAAAVVALVSRGFMKEIPRDFGGVYVVTEAGLLALKKVSK